MRLPNTRTFQFEEFFPSQLPVYAILSHTRGTEEISLREIRSPDADTKRKNGYLKTKATCELALKEQYSYIWIDTCCIDKSSSAELSEAINSMFAWYAGSAECYAYLSDISMDDDEGFRNCLRSSRWFTRGWTLQELLAPRELVFYDMNWSRKGSRSDYLEEVSTRTGIPSCVLSRFQPLNNCSVAMKMSWAANRQTTRAEDMAYCLLGIFDINMPMLYGEGSKAFRRLQEEIIKRDNDMTIFAWDYPMLNANHQRATAPLLAPSVAEYANQRLISPFKQIFFSFTLTNKALFIPDEQLLGIAKLKQKSGSAANPTTMYILFLGSTGGFERCGICLRKVGPKLFYRDGRFPLFEFHIDEIEGCKEVIGCYILLDPRWTDVGAAAQHRDEVIRVPEDSVWGLGLVFPEDRWDESDRLFVKRNPTVPPLEETVFTLLFKGKLRGVEEGIAVLCDYRGATPVATIVKALDNIEEVKSIFSEQRQRISPFSWSELQTRFYSAFNWGSTYATFSPREGVRPIVSVALEKGWLDHEARRCEVYDLKITTAFLPS